MVLTGCTTAVSWEGESEPLPSTVYVYPVGPHSLLPPALGHKERLYPEPSRCVCTQSPGCIGQQGPTAPWGWESSCHVISNFSELLNSSGKFSLPFD